MLPLLRRCSAAAARPAGLHGPSRAQLGSGAARRVSVQHASGAESVEVFPALLHIQWQDGTRSELNANWLRERCLSSAAVDSQTRQPLANPHDLPECLSMVDAKLHGNSQLDVVFSDGHHSQFFLPRVQSELRSFDRSPIQVNEYDRPSPVLWSGDAYELPVFQHDEVLEDGDEGERLRLIKGLLTSGAALVKGVPRREGEVCRFGQTLSTLRTTNWGSFFNVRTVPDTSAEAGGPKFDLAYTPRPIGFHTDNPYRDRAPDFQLLHALEHCSCPAGAAPCEGCSVLNYLVDGFYVAEKLRKESPDSFRLLTEVPVRFENNGGDNDSALLHTAPHIELSSDVSQHDECTIRALRFSAKSGQYAPPLDSETLEAFYRARRRFSQLAHDKTHICTMQLEPGDCLVFDNQRLLHARSEIRPSDGDRWVQGCYIDRDGLWLNYERLRRRARRE